MLAVGLTAYDVIAPAHSKLIASTLLAPLLTLTCSLLIAASTGMLIPDPTVIMKLMSNYQSPQISSPSCLSSCNPSICSLISYCFNRFYHNRSLHLQLTCTSIVITLMCCCYHPSASFIYYRSMLTTTCMSKGFLRLAVDLSIGK